MALYSKHFYHQIIRKYVIAFGTLFSNINVIRKSSDGTELHRENVPLTFASKEKFYQRLVQDYSQESRISIKLPHIAFEITDYQYDTSRKLNSKKTFGKTDDKGNHSFYYNPVPYNIGFNLYVFTKTQEEGLQIVEQILPFFTPDYVLTLKLTDKDSIKTDIPISLTNVSIDDTYEGDFETRRSIIWTLSFVLKGYLIGPERKQGIVLNSTVNNRIVENFEDKSFSSTLNFPGVFQYSIFEGISEEPFETDLKTFLNGNNIIAKKDVGINSDIFIKDLDGSPYNFDNKIIRAEFRKNMSEISIPLNISIISNGNLNLSYDTTLLNTGLYIFSIFEDNNQSGNSNILLSGFILITN